MGYPNCVDDLVPGGDEVLVLPESIRKEWAGLASHKQSPSSIVSFLQCPLKWFAERHLEAMHNATGDTILDITSFTRQPPNQWAVGGTLSHRALEVFYSEPPDNRTAGLLEEIYDFAWEMLAKGDFRDGIVSKSMVDDYNTMLDNLAGRDLPVKSFKSRFRSTYRDITLAALDMERPKSVMVEGNESFIRLERGRMQINGKIDRVDRTLKGQEIIVDYKTGRSSDGPTTIFNPTYLPCGIYGLARTEESERTPSAREVSGVRLLYLKEARAVSIRTTDEVLDDVDDVLTMVAEEMDAIGETGELPLLPSPSAEEMPCKWCPLRPVCPAWT